MLSTHGISAVYDEIRPIVERERFEIKHIHTCTHLADERFAFLVGPAPEPFKLRLQRPGNGVRRSAGTARALSAAGERHAQLCRV